MSEIIELLAGMLRKRIGNYTSYSKIVNEYNFREIIQMEIELRAIF